MFKYFSNIYSKNISNVNLDSSNGQIKFDTILTNFTPPGFNMNFPQNQQDNNNPGDSNDPDDLNHVDWKRKSRINPTNANTRWVRLCHPFTNFTGLVYIFSYLPGKSSEGIY